MSEELPDQPSLIPPEQNIKKKKEKELPDQNPAFKRGRKPHPIRNIYYEENNDQKNETPTFKAPSKKPEEERLLPWEESDKRLKELIKFLDEKDKNK